jgi:hypothetical protein
LNWPGTNWWPCRRSLNQLRCQRGIFADCRWRQRDIVLGAGETWQVTGGMVISALADAGFSLIAQGTKASAGVVFGAEAGRRGDLQRRWKSLPLAAYPATLLR